MFRQVIVVLICVLAAPCLALLTLYFGCRGPRALLGNACGHNVPISAVGLTLLMWLFLGIVGLVFRLQQDPR
jgi:hypothetical protein